MKRLVIWFIDTVSVFFFLVFLVVGFFLGYSGSDFVYELGTSLGIDGYATMSQDAKTGGSILLGLVTLLIAFIVGSLIFGFLFLLLNMNNNIQAIRNMMEQSSEE